MHYFTSVEISKKWGLSPREVKDACQNGQIEGAVEKEGQWLIPEDARILLDKYPGAGNTAAENLSRRKQEYDINQVDYKNDEWMHKAGGIYKSIGVTRETLRYYEKLGLVESPRNLQNDYREFDFTTMVRLMVIDFYKKCGFSAKEVSELAADDSANLEERFLAKENELDEKISGLQKIKKKLVESRDFYAETMRNLDAVRIKEFPLYRVLEEIPGIGSFDLYENMVLPNLDAEYEDILSNQIRAISFDKNGFQDNTVYIVREEEGLPQKDVEYLQYGKCIYTVVKLSSTSNPELPYAMRDKLLRWAEEKQKTLKGIAYLSMKMGAFHAAELSYLMEVWIPVE